MPNAMMVTALMKTIVSDLIGKIRPQKLIDRLVSGKDL